MKPLIILAAVVAAFAAFCVVGPRLTSAAPDFTLTTTSGDPVTLSSLKGRVVVIDFWASWCPPCRAAIPAMQRLHEHYASRGVIVLGINLRESIDPREFMDSMGASYTVLRDDGRVAAQYRVKGIPAFRVIDKQGTIVYSGAGFGGRIDADIRKAVDAALAK